MSLSLCADGLTENVKEENRFGRIILKCIWRQQCIRVWTGFIWIRMGTCAGLCVYGNVPSGSI